MKLNHDCVRQVMLDIEENQALETVDFNDVITKKTVDTYGIDNVIYSLLQLADADYIKIKAFQVKEPHPLILIKQITWEGHKFLDNTRDSKVWSKTKAVLSHIEGASLTVASNVASQVITNLIKGYLEP